MNGIVTVVTTLALHVRATRAQGGFSTTVFYTTATFFLCEETLAFFKVSKAITVSPPRVFVEVNSNGQQQ